MSSSDSSPEFDRAMDLLMFIAAVVLIAIPFLFLFVALGG